MLIALYLYAFGLPSYGVLLLWTTALLFTWFGQTAYVEGTSPAERGY